MLGRDRVAYGCPNCDEPLSSNQNECGQASDCPACELTFTVPGRDLVDYRRRTLAKAAKERQRLKADRKAEKERQARLRAVERERSRRERERQLEAKRAQAFSDELVDYLVVGPDFGRGSGVDRFCQKHFRKSLVQAFSGMCASCGEGMSQLEFDHFWHPKSKGGNFAMRRKTTNGIVYANNCIPLCGSCNGSKGARSASEFFGQERYSELTTVCLAIQEELNDVMRDCKDNYESEPVVVTR
jgi:5-methylcytosine-specific restriction endonuclease McrA